MGDETKKKKKKKLERERRQGAIAMLHSSSSTSCRRIQSPPEVHTVGCMSGIFQLIAKYHTRRKLLTSGKKQDKDIVVATEEGEQQKSSYVSNIKVEIDQTKSIDSLPVRSPVLRLEMQRSDFSESMAVAAAAAAADEKRRILLVALQKCDEDLRELKKIILDFRSDSINGSVVKGIGGREMGKSVTELSGEEQPSPVSVLDAFTRSPPPPVSSCARRSLQYGNIQLQQQPEKNKHGQDILSTIYLQNIEIVMSGSNHNHSSTPWCSSGVIVATVEKICNEIAWGENRETGRIGMALQDQIYRELIEETVKELAIAGKGPRVACNPKHSTDTKPTRHACRRRLSF